MAITQELNKKAEGGEKTVRRLAYFSKLTKIYVVKMDYEVIYEDLFREVVKDHLHPGKIMRVKDLDKMLETAQEFTPESLIDDMMKRVMGLRNDEESIDAFFGSARHVIDGQLILESYLKNQEVENYPLGKMVEFKPEKLAKWLEHTKYPVLKIADLIVKPAIYCSSSR